MIILAIDPGSEQSAFVVWDGRYLIEIGIVPNEHMRYLLTELVYDHLAVEMVESYGMPVGKEVFQTVLWIGRFIEIARGHDKDWAQVYRSSIKLHLCNSRSAKDSNIRQVLLDRYGKTLTKGVHKDIWSALAIATFYLDTFDSIVRVKEEEEPCLNA